jgi:hypothetical protein
VYLRDVGTYYDTSKISLFRSVEICLRILSQIGTKRLALVFHNIFRLCPPFRSGCLWTTRTPSKSCVATERTWLLIQRMRHHLNLSLERACRHFKGLEKATGSNVSRLTYESQPRNSIICLQDRITHRDYLICFNNAFQFIETHSSMHQHVPTNDSGYTTISLPRQCPLCSLLD